MIKEASKYQVHQIFSIEESIEYIVPKYQREYTWTQKHWDNLVNDLIENDSGYFLGPILCISREKDALKLPRPLEIIDGQQRLISISLLFAAIYKLFTDYQNSHEEKKEDIEFNNEIYNLSYKLTQKREDIRGSLKIKPSLQSENLQVYEWILNNLKIYNKSEVKRPKQLGNKRLYKAYNFFVDTLSKIKDINEIRDFLFKLNQAWFVMIQVENHSDAFKLFECLNNRGMPLAPMDLIKNNLISKMEKKSIGSINDIFDKWKIILDYLENYKIQIRFLRQYYNAFKYKEDIKIENIFKATKSNIIDIYEKLIKKNPEFLLKEFLEKSLIYNQFIKTENEELDIIESYKIKFKDLQNIGGAPSYTLLLYLFSEHKSNIKLIEDILDFLIKYFVRRNLTDFPNTRLLDQIFIDTIQICEKNKDALSSKTIIDFFKQPDKLASSEEFLKELSADIYEKNIQATRFILTKIEEENFTDETKRNLWEKKQNKLVWTIEHILPQTKNLNETWIEMIATGDREKARELHKQYTHKIGNLTLTRYNPNLSNSSFIEKRDKKDKKGNPIGFKNGLTLNKELAKKDKWTIKDIEDRSKRLIEKSIDLFKI